jgi:hypothetical protein
LISSHLELLIIRRETGGEGVDGEDHVGPKLLLVFEVDLDVVDVVYVYCVFGLYLVVGGFGNARGGFIRSPHQAWRAWRSLQNGRGGI